MKWSNIRKLHLNPRYKRVCLRKWKLPGSQLSSHNQRHTFSLLQNQNQGVLAYFLWDSCDSWIKKTFLEGGEAGQVATNPKILRSTLSHFVFTLIVFLPSPSRTQSFNPKFHWLWCVHPLLLLTSHRTHSKVFHLVITFHNLAPYTPFFYHTTIMPQPGLLGSNNEKYFCPIPVPQMFPLVTESTQKPKSHLNPSGSQVPNFTT
jgi:hypothetical protein